MYFRPVPAPHRPIRTPARIDGKRLLRLRFALRFHSGLSFGNPAPTAQATLVTAARPDFADNANAELDQRKNAIRVGRYAASGN